MPSKALVGAACWCVLSCAGTPPPAPKTEPAATPAKTSAPVSAVREASSRLRRYWVHGQSPQLALYADLSGLLHSEAFEALLPDLLSNPAVPLRPKQRDCAKALVEGARALAVGSDERGTLALLELSDEGLRQARNACVGALFPVDRIQVAGADEAYAADENVVAVEPGVVLVGPKPVVEAALAKKGSPWPSSLALLGDQQLSWQLQAGQGRDNASGAFSIGHEHLGASAELEASSEQLAQSTEADVAGMRQQAAALSGTMLPAEQVAVIKQLVDSASVKRVGKQLSFAVELKGGPPKQVAVLGALTAMTIYGVRKYMANAKTAEARNVVAQIAKDYASYWYAETMDSGALAAKPKPRAAPKKLVSLPAVPAVVPRGMKYQSAADDWKAWQLIKFSFSEPQYYQYEVAAAKDGKSATVFARGDLDGDGTPSEFRITLTVNPKTNDLVIQPTVDESNPEE